MIAILDLSEKVMGKVHTTLTIVNRADQVLVENGSLNNGVNLKGCWRIVRVCDRF